MLIETIRACKDALSSTELYGVNTQIPLVERDNGDDQPPLLVTFADETRNPETALRRSTENRPALLFTLPTTVDFVADVMSGVREGTVTIQLTLLYDNTETAEAKQDFLYTIRAIQRSLRVWMENDYANTRTRNFIHLQALTGMTLGEMFSPLEDGSVSGTLLIQFLVRDVAP